MPPLPPPRAVRHLAAVALAALALAPLASALPALCDDTQRLSRTFEPPPARPSAAVAASVFEITRDDFFRMYPYGAEVHMGFADGDEVRQIDVGFTADGGPFAWTVPTIDLEVMVWTITDPATTPFAHLAPGATHVLVTDSDPEFDGTIYDYYTAEADQFVFNVLVAVPNDGSGNEEDRSNQPLFPFPLDASFEYADSGVYFFEDEEDIDPNRPFYAAQSLGFHRYGALTAPDGSTVDGGMLYADVEFYDLETEELFEWDTHYSFFGDDGSLYQFRIADNPGEGDTPTQGEVWIDEIEFSRVVMPPVDVTEGPRRATPWTVFPNPAADFVRFSQPLTATVFDMIGRPVREARQASEVDLRGLASGTYVIRSAAGDTRRVTVRR